MLLWRCSFFLVVSFVGLFSRRYAQIRFPQIYADFSHSKPLTTHHSLLIFPADIRRLRPADIRRFVF